MSLVRLAYVSRLSICMLALVLTLLGSGLSSSYAMPKQAAALAGFCTREALASGTIVRVIDDTFVLADGQVRTAGIDVPPLPHPSRDGPVSPAVIGSGHPSDDTGAVAPGALRAPVTGREVVLTGSAMSSNGFAGSITKFLVTQRLVRLAAHAGRAAWPLRTTVRAPATAKLGLSCNPRYFARADQDAAGISAERGRFTLIDGRIVWRESGGTVYVNDVNLG